MILNVFVLLRAVNVEFKVIEVMEELRNTPEKHPRASKIKFICLTLLIISGITYSRSEQYEVVGPVDPVIAVPGEDVILPCSVKPNTSVVDMRVEWFRPGINDILVHLYKDYDDRNTEQIQTYRGRTKLNHQELQRGNASLKLSSVQVSDEGRYRCFIQSKSWYDEATVDLIVEAVGSPPVITVDGFDHSERLHLQCESKGWYPEPDIEWLDSGGVSLSSETTESHRNANRFSVKHTITVHHTGSKIHCRVKLKHHMLETLIVTSSKRFNPWRTSVILSSIAVALIVIAGMLIAAFVRKNREHEELQNENMRKNQEHDQLQNEKRNIQQECSQLQEEITKIQEEYNKLLQNENMNIKQEFGALWKDINIIQKECDQLQNDKRKIQKEHDQKQNEKGNVQKVKKKWRIF